MQRHNYRFDDPGSTSRCRHVPLRLYRYVLFPVPSRLSNCHCSRTSEIGIVETAIHPNHGKFNAGTPIP